MTYKIIMQILKEKGSAYPCCGDCHYGQYKIYLPIFWKKQFSCFLNKKSVWKTDICENWIPWNLTYEAKTKIKQREGYLCKNQLCEKYKEILKNDRNIFCLEYSKCKQPKHGSKY